MKKILALLLTLSSCVTSSAVSDNPYTKQRNTGTTKYVQVHVNNWNANYARIHCDNSTVVKNIRNLIFNSVERVSFDSSACNQMIIYATINDEVVTQRLSILEVSEFDLYIEPSITTSYIVPRSR